MFFILKYLFFIQLFFGTAYAKIPLADLKYRQSLFSTQDLQFKKYLDKTKIIKNLESIGQLPLIKSGPFSLRSMDAIFTDSVFHKAIFIKLGIRPTDKKWQNKMIKVDQSYIYHFSKNGSSLAIFFRNFNNQEVLDILDIWQKEWQNRTASTSVFYKLFFYQAQAQLKNGTLDPAENIESKVDCLDCESSQFLSTWSKWKQTAINIVETLQVKTPAQILFSCFQGSLQGAWDASGGMVVGLGTGTYNLVTQPVQSAQNFWQGANDVFDTLQKFYRNFQTEAAKIYHGFETLSLEEKSKLACQVLTSVGVGSVVAAFTAGTAAPLVAQKMKKTLSLLNQNKLDDLEMEKIYAMATTITKDPDIDLTALEATQKVIEQDLNRSLYSLTRKDPLQNKMMNQATLQRLEDHPQVVRNPKRKVGFSESELQDLYAKVANSPVTGLCALKKYDPTKKTGFCFGRAMATHIEALKMGLDKDQIKKIWALGRIDGRNGTHWDYHVSTVVRQQDGAWYVIDPSVENAPIPVKKWVAEMQIREVDGLANIFVTEPQRFTPTSARDKNFKYDKTTFKDSNYNNYFQDMLTGFREESKTIPSKN